MVNELFDLLKKDTVMKAAAQGAKPPSPELTLAQQRTGQGNPTGRTKVNPTFETALTPQEETQFQTWRKKYVHPNDDGRDYDLRGAFKAGVMPAGPEAGADAGHFPDTFKKPSHETFSDESIYSSLTGTRPGTWTGPNHDQYQPMRPAGIPATVPSSGTGTTMTLPPGARFTEDTPVETQLNHNAHDKKKPQGIHPGSAQSYQAPTTDAEPPNILPKAFHSAISIAMRRVGLMPKIPQTQPGPEILTDVSTMAKPGYNLSENNQLEHVQE